MRANVLSTVLSAAGLAMAAPYDPPYNPPSCVQKSSQIRDWTVKDFDFHASYIFTTPAHQNSWGYVNFTLENSAVPYAAECTASSSQLTDFFYGNFAYQCKVPNQADSATFTFNRPNGDLMINQTWYCLEEKSRFEARGGTRLNLTCTEKFEQNPNWRPDQPHQFYSTRYINCQHVTAKVPITDISAVA